MQVHLYIHVNLYYIYSTLEFRLNFFRALYFNVRTYMKGKIFNVKRS